MIVSGASLASQTRYAEVFRVDLLDVGRGDLALRRPTARRAFAASAYNRELTREDELTNDREARTEERHSKAGSKYGSLTLLRGGDLMRKLEARRNDAVAMRALRNL